MSRKTHISIGTILRRAQTQTRFRYSRAARTRPTNRNRSIPLHLDISQFSIDRFLPELPLSPRLTARANVLLPSAARCVTGVFIGHSRAVMYSHVQVGDEILAVNLVDVTHMSLDDVVIIMSIPRRLVLATRHGPHQPVSHSRQTEHKAPPVVVIKRELNEDENDHVTSNHVRYSATWVDFSSVQRKFHVCP